MTDTDKVFTKIAANSLILAKEICDYGIDNKLITEKDVRFTIAKRQETAKALVNGGMSRRQAAKVLGVSHVTVMSDVGGKKLTKNGSKSTTRELLSQSDQNDWRTPRKYLDAARAVMNGIDLDPASSPEANKTVKAKKFYTEETNGLEKPWKGKIWLNPPYGGDARLFVERLIREYQVGNVTAACALLNSHPTETKWFQELFKYTICFVRGRIDFGGPSRDVSSTSTHGSAIAYLGDDVEKFKHKFSEFGAVVRMVA